MIHNTGNPTLTALLSSQSWPVIVAFVDARLDEIFSDPAVRSPHDYSSPEDYQARIDNAAYAVQRAEAKAQAEAQALRDERFVRAVRRWRGLKANKRAVELLAGYTPIKLAA